MVIGHETEICCPQEYHGMWKNDYATVRISALGTLIIIRNRCHKLYGRICEEYNDLGYSVSYQNHKTIYYLSIAKGASNNVLLFKLSTNERGKVKTIFDLRLRAD